jgi:hypothetical protein
MKALILWGFAFSNNPARQLEREQCCGVREAHAGVFVVSLSPRSSADLPQNMVIVADQE